jgi:hypothetical protein
VNDTLQHVLLLSWNVQEVSVFSTFCMSDIFELQLVYGR